MSTDAVYDAYISGNVPLANSLALARGLTVAEGANYYKLSANDLAQMYARGFRFADQQGASLAGLQLSPPILVVLAIAALLLLKHFRK